jgi:hypothetical protein|tara:strand:+ start:2139 stop:3026 length:888 start_codon:yes stop_codon:yes gene_type:complete
MSVADVATGLLSAGGQYYLSEENIKDTRKIGEDAQAGAALIAEQAKEDTAFQPYTATSSLANVATTAEGGFGINLTPEQQAAQDQLQGQAVGMFEQAQTDPLVAQQLIYDQMRGIQRPEEERNRLMLQERMFAQGRGGVQSSAYGGASPEMLAYETARQDAMAKANLAARSQVMGEQAQAVELGGLLQNAAYEPQQQALDLLGAATPAAGFVDVGNRTGAELSSQLNLGGLEALIQSEDLASRLTLQQQDALLESLMGTNATPLEQAQIDKIYAELGIPNPNTGGGLLQDIIDLI